MQGGAAAIAQLKLYYQCTDWSGIATATPATNRYAALHSAWPGRTGNQTTNEVSYTGYARKAIPTADGFTVSTDPDNVTLSLASTVTFSRCTGGSATARFFSFGSASSGTGQIRHIGIFGSLLGPFTGASSDNITIPGLSGVSEGDSLVFTSVSNSSLPSGITEGTAYTVKTVSGDAVTISSDGGTTTLDIGAGDGIAHKSTPISISDGVAPQLAGTEESTPLVLYTR